ncbi:MAG: transcription elongation factor GreA [Candidatus Nanopelagicales bacterium]
MSDVTWLTQEAFDALQAELAEREGPRRAEIVKRIELAREEGDLKENSGYHAAKDEQGHNEARIKQLKAMLDKAKVGSPDSAHDEAAHGKVVTVRFPSLDMDETFLLASREEAAHASIEVYSPTSPLGAAVDGRKVGDRASYKLPNGTVMEIEIVSVTDYTP